MAYDCSIAHSFQVLQTIHSANCHTLKFIKKIQPSQAMRDSFIYRVSEQNYRHIFLQGSAYRM